MSMSMGGREGNANPFPLSHASVLYVLYCKILLRFSVVKSSQPPEPYVLPSSEHR